MRPTSRFASALIPAFVLAACGGGGNAASTLAKPPEFQPKGETKCAVAKSQSRPLIVEWPSSDRLDLETKMHDSLVAVRYSGCEMEVLDRCFIPATYKYKPGSRKQDTLVVRDEDDLYANLPVGAAKLESKLARAGKLTVQMSLIGRYEAEKANVRADELQGECAGATHFVYGLTVGAFDFFAGGEAEVGGAAGIGGAGVGAHSKAERESLSRDGNVEACAQATEDAKAPPNGCRALIRVEVVPLGEARKVVGEVQCPGGTKFDGSKCVASVDTSCASGMHFETGRGCVGDTAAPPATHAAAPAPEAPQKAVATCNRACAPSELDAAGCCPNAPSNTRSCNRACAPQERNAEGCCPETSTPPSSGAPAPADDDKILQEAQDAYVHGQYANAIDLARKVSKTSPSKAWRIMGASSCFLKDRNGAMTAWNKLDAQGRQFLKYVCSRNAITVP